MLLRQPLGACLEEVYPYEEDAPRAYRNLATPAMKKLRSEGMYTSTQRGHITLSPPEYLVTLVEHYRDLPQGGIAQFLGQTASRRAALVLKVLRRDETPEVLAELKKLL